MGRIKIQNLDNLDEIKKASNGVREIIVWILFFLILAAGAFGWGYIYKDHWNDDLREKIYQFDVKQRDMNGRLIAIEGKSEGKRK